MAKKLTANQRYSKERKRLMDALREVKKAGFIPKIELPTVRQLQKQGKDVAKEARRLSRIRGRKVSEIEVIDRDTGEILTLRQARKIIREAPSIHMIDIIIAKFDAMPDYKDFWSGRRRVERIDYRTRYNIIVQIIYDNVKEYGERAVERHLTDREERINICLEEQKYESDSETVLRSFIELANLVRMGTLTIQQLSEISDLGEMYTYEET